MSPSIWQLLIVLVIVLLLFGAKRLRNVGSDLGSAVKGFKTAMSDEEKAEQEEKEREEKEQEDSQPGRLQGDGSEDADFTPEDRRKESEREN